MGDDGKARCAAVAERLDGAQLLQVAEAAARSGHWPAVIALLQRMDSGPQAEMMALLGQVPARTADSLVVALDAAEAWPLPLLADAWPRRPAAWRVVCRQQTEPGRACRRAAPRPVARTMNDRDVLGVPLKVA